jgi:hypothetical protein
MFFALVSDVCYDYAISTLVNDGFAIVAYFSKLCNVSYYFK